MGSQPGDPEFDSLVAIGARLQQDYLSDDRWEGSPFEWIKKRPSRQKGKVAEDLVIDWLREKELKVGPSRGSDSDCLVEGQPTEIKSSTLWQGGHYRFQQIRDQDYKILICLGLSPQEAHAWVFPKGLLMRLWRDGTIPSQHGGASGSDTAWLQVSVGDVVEPEWVHEWGGSLEKAFGVLRNMLS